MRKAIAPLVALFVTVFAAQAQNAPATPGTSGSAIPTNQTTAPKHIRISGAVAVGLLDKQIPLLYPEKARRAYVEGTVIMTATIDTEGKVSNLSVISGPELLREAAMSAVQQWTYHPYKLNGEPVIVDTTITCVFKMNHASPQF